MKISINRTLAFLGTLCFLLVSCAVQPQAQRPKVTVVSKSEMPPIPKESPKTIVKEETFKVALPEVKREFRGAWVATVANIDWPSTKKLSTEAQQKEAIELLDLLADAHFNAVIFQVRPSADALYESNYEPWSCFLCGETGRKPMPYYDPLAFWIQEAHKRGMELHVWINPYRAHHLSGGRVGSASMVHKASDYIVKLKNGMYWFDPASKKTQDHVANVVKDIVQRYDIDGVHFDDYFYPYASYNGGADFPDNVSWNAYQKNGGTLSRSDWRRDQVNHFIERIYKEIKVEKPYVKFGISPFGIWKSGYPQGVVGFSQYDELYADAKLWLNKGWVDYFSPQLYWPIDAPKQGFESLLKWWEAENTQHRHLWPGLNTVEVKASNRATEIVNQIEITQKVLDKNSVGAVHYSVAGLTKNPEMVAALKEGPYKEKALVPASPWIKGNKIAQPILKINNETQNVLATWSDVSDPDVFQWVLYTRYENTWTTEILAHNITTKNLSKYKNGQKLTAIALKAIDRLGNESDYVAMKI